MQVRALPLEPLIQLLERLVVESEIVWTSTDSRRDMVDSMSSALIATDIKLTLFRSDDKVAMVTSHLLTGRPRNSTKRYWKWRTIQSTGFRRTQSGLAQPYFARRPINHHGWMNSVPTVALDLMDPFSPHYGDSDAGRAFREAMWQTFGVRGVEEIYPMTRHFGVTKYQAIPYNLRKAFRQPDVEQFTTEAFGKTRYTAKLSAAVDKSDPWFIALAKDFRGYVSTDEIVDFLNDVVIDDATEQVLSQMTSPNVRKVLRASPSSAQNLLKSTLTQRGLTAAHATSAALNHVSRRKQRLSPLRTHPLKTWDEAFALVRGF